MHARNRMSTSTRHKHTTTHALARMNMRVAPKSTRYGYILMYTTGCTSRPCTHAPRINTLVHACACEYTPTRTPHLHAHFSSHKDTSVTCTCTTHRYTPKPLLALTTDTQLYTRVHMSTPQHSYPCAPPHFYVSEVLAANHRVANKQRTEGSHEPRRTRAS